MRYISALLVALAFAAASANAQVLVGNADAVDGDSLRMTGTDIRIFGIDAVEATQTCQRSAQLWACGQEAKAAMAALVSRSGVACQQRDTDVYGRSVATCRAGSIDLGLAMIEAGLAVALPNAPSEYHEAEARRRDARFGIWGSEFQMPADYRKANPRFDPRPRVIRTDRATEYSVSRPGSRSSGEFSSCAQALAAGAAPFYRGDPNYRAYWDGDNDGIACEPYRGRRR